MNQAPTEDLKVLCATVQNLVTSATQGTQICEPDQQVCELLNKIYHREPADMFNMHQDQITIRNTVVK